MGYEFLTNDIKGFEVSAKITIKIMTEKNNNTKQLNQVF